MANDVDVNKIIEDIDGVEAVNFRSRGGLSQQMALEAGPILLDIARENEGLTPDMVVERARDVDSPLHKHFTWDDKHAASMFRNHQARHLISSIEIKLTVTGEAPQWVKCFHTVKIPITRPPSEQHPEGEKAEIRRYLPMEMVQQNQNYLSQVVDSAYRQIIQWQQQYTQYRHMKEFNERFTGVMTSVDELIEQNGTEK